MFSPKSCVLNVGSLYTHTPGVTKRYGQAFGMHSSHTMKESMLCGHVSGNS